MRDGIVVVKGTLGGFEIALEEVGSI